MSNNPQLYIPPPGFCITPQNQYLNSWQHTNQSGLDFYPSFAEEPWAPLEKDLWKSYHDDRGNANHFWNKVNMETIGQVGKVNPQYVMKTVIPKFPIPFDYECGDWETLWDQPTYYS